MGAPEKQRQNTASRFCSAAGHRDRGNRICVQGKYTRPVYFGGGTLACCSCARQRALLGAGSQENKGTPTLRDLSADFIPFPFATCFVSPGSEVGKFWVLPEGTHRQLSCGADHESPQVNKCVPKSSLRPAPGPEGRVRSSRGATSLPCSHPGTDGQGEVTTRGWGCSYRELNNQTPKTHSALRSNARNVEMFPPDEH